MGVSSPLSNAHGAFGERSQELDSGTKRLDSLDAYRGAIMLVLVVGPFVHGVTGRFQESPSLAWISSQFEHVAWSGFALWDLIAPTFIFIVGVSLPYSCASRARRGEPRSRMGLHVAKRSLIFFVLGLLLTSKGFSETRFNFATLLGQVALAYPFAFLMVGRGRTFQTAVTTLILVGWWLAFVLYPQAPPGFDFASVGVPDDVERFTGLFGHWNRGTNLAADFDVWFLNLFPRPEVYQFHPVGNQTLAFIPKVATMILGVMAGELLASDRSMGSKRNRLLGAGVALLVLGWGLGLTVCPLIKSIWTSSWALFSGGWALFALGAFFGVVEIGGYARLAFPAVVFGVNSITIYLMYALVYEWLTDVAAIHLTNSWSLQQVFAIGALWGFCFWLYRRRIFLRV